MRLVLCVRSARQPIRDALVGLAGVELIEADDMARLIGEVPLADALVLSDPRGPEGALLAEALRRPDEKLRWVQMISAGYAGLVAHPLPPSVAVTNQGGIAAPAVAEHALALIMALNRGLPTAFAAQLEQRWDPKPIRTHLRTLEGATVVIVGLGHVGRALAKRLAPFGATIVGVNRNGAPSSDVDRTVAIAALDSALAEADVVAVCLPGSPETRGLFGAERLAAIRPGACLVNVGRGEVVDAGALAAALHDGHLGGAALDVTDPEPLPADNPLWRAPNAIVTPHIGGGSPHSGKRIAQLVVENAGRFMRGEPLLNQVHPKADT